MKRIGLLVTFLCINLVCKANSSIEALTKASSIKTEIMVLGTPHLSQVQSPLSSTDFHNLHQILKKFNPEAIAVESLRPNDINSMLGNSQYLPVLQQFVGESFIQLSKEMQSELNLDFFQASQKLSQPKSAEDKLSNRFKTSIAALDKTNATFYWSQMKEEERDIFSENIQEYFNKRLTRNNEIQLIAMPLAQLLGHKKLYSIDDHQDKDQLIPITKPLMTELNKSGVFAELMASDYITKPQKLISQAEKSKNWLPVYSWFNGKEYQAQVIEQEWQTFIKQPIENNLGNARLALWDLRNLNMASHIMRIAAMHPGERILVVVGANHKIFLETILSKMMAVTIVEFK